MANRIRAGCVVFVAAVASTTACALRTGPAASQARDICSDQRWEGPYAIAELGVRHSIARFASVTQWENELVTVGMNVPFVIGAPNDTMLFIGGERSAIPRPPGHWFVYPKVIAQSDSVLVMLWTEPDERTPRSRALPPDVVQTLWSAEYKRGGEWSPKEKLGTWRRIISPLSASVQRDQQHGTLGFVAIAIGDTAGSNLYYLRRENGQWSRRTVSGTQGATYGSLAIVNSHLLVSFIAPSNSSDETPRTQNRIMVTRSEDNGLTWTAPAAITLKGTGDRRVSDLIVRSGPSSDVHLLWRIGAPGELRSYGIGHAYSQDGGKTWVEESPFPSIGGALAAFDAAVNSCGAVQVAYEHWSNPIAGHVDAVRWTAAGWSSPTHFLEGAVALSPQVIVDRRGQTYLTMITGPANITMSDTMQTVRARLRPR